MILNIKFNIKLKEFFHNCVQSARFYKYSLYYKGAAEPQRGQPLEKVAKRPNQRNIPLNNINKKQILCYHNTSLCSNFYFASKNNCLKKISLNLKMLNRTF